MNKKKFSLYKFKNMSLLKKALSHTSFCHENQKECLEDNERLEFLGDAVVDLISSRILYDKFPDLDEGGLSKMRNSLVQEKTLASFALKIGLDKMMFLGKGENPKRPSLLADSFEALIGAIYLDSNLDQAQKVFLKVIKKFNEADLFSIDHAKGDYKTRLQEIVLKEFHELPIYKEDILQGGKFKSCLYIKGRLITSAIDTSKKKAQMKLAEKVIKNKLYIKKKRSKYVNRAPASRQ